MSLRHGITVVLSLTALAAIVAYLSVRATLPSYPYPWTPYALSVRHHRLELIVDGTPAPLEYRSRDDCLAAAAAELRKPVAAPDSYLTDGNDSAASGYAPPFGCHYSGYADPIAQRVASAILRPHRFRCIVKIAVPSPDPQQYLYFPVLPGLPQGDEGYCVP